MEEFNQANFLLLHPSTFFAPSRDKTYQVTQSDMQACLILYIHDLPHSSSRDCFTTLVFPHTRVRLNQKTSTRVTECAVNMGRKIL